ncbi:MAG: sec-independent translocase [Streptosporangiaceae bacterium]
MFFDLSIWKILALLLVGLVIFGPEQLPKFASQVGRALRDLRRLTESARSDLADSLGQEFRDFDLEDLNPRTFVRKHLLDDDIASELNDDWVNDAVSGPGDLASVEVGAAAHPLIAGEVPPYDAEAT